jgi:putative (di)nucleoside polyphosphate hydrolase
MNCVETPEPLPGYRPCVGIFLLNRAGLAFVGQRLDTPVDAWQMPQGGIDRGETPAEAALRELGEETGIEPHQVELLEELDPWLFYDFPPALKARLTGPYFGQRQKWFAFRFLGSDTDVRLDRHTIEFDAWKWADLQDTPGLVIPFKAAVYSEVAKHFAKWTTPA